MALISSVSARRAARFARFSASESLASRFAATALHAGLWVAVAATLYGLGVVRTLPASASAGAAHWGGLPWDAGWFASIAQDGYSFDPTGQSNVAFFPLFPLIWRWSGLGPLGISLLNAAVFLVAATLLAHTLQLSRRTMLLALSAPATLFMLIPYSEAWFFLFGAALLIGLHRGHTGWLVVGLLGCGLTRSASSLFTPALLFTTGLLLAQGHTRKGLWWSAVGLLTLAASVGLVIAYQTSFPGVPAMGFALSHAAWDHKLQWPVWPLFSDAGSSVLWFSAVAAAIGTVAGLACLGLAVHAGWQRVRGKPVAAVSAAVVFSLGYCFAALLFVLAFQEGKLAGLHRYIFSGPFFTVLVWQVYQWPAWRPWAYAAIGAGLLAFWQVFGAWGHLNSFSMGQSAWYFGLTTAYALAWLGVRHWRYAREIGTGLYLFNLVYQLYLLDLMLRGGWIE